VHDALQRPFLGRHRPEPHYFAHLDAAADHARRDDGLVRVPDRE
jgi:hypothetical protein